MSFAEVERIEAKIAAAELRILAIRNQLSELADVQANIALDAAERRAANALQGRGLGGALFGAKYRAAARRSAAADNARLSQDVARRKREVADVKQRLKASERALKLEIATLKMDLRSAKAATRTIVRASALPSPSPPLPAQPLSKEQLKLELQKLKAQFEAGTLDTAAYERERIRLLTPFT